MKLTVKQRLLQKKDENFKLLRRFEYPSIAEQLDMLYWDMVNGTTDWMDTITAIKENLPKQELPEQNIKVKISKKRKPRKKKNR